MSLPIQHKEPSIVAFILIHPYCFPRGRAGLLDLGLLLLALRAGDAGREAARALVLLAELLEREVARALVFLEGPARALVPLAGLLLRGLEALTRALVVRPAEAGRDTRPDLELRAEEDEREPRMERLLEGERERDPALEEEAERVPLVALSLLIERNDPLPLVALPLLIEREPPRLGDPLWPPPRFLVALLRPRVTGALL